MNNNYYIGEYIPRYTYVSGAPHQTPSGWTLKLVNGSTIANITRTPYLYSKDGMVECSYRWRISNFYLTSAKDEGLTHTLEKAQSNLERRLELAGFVKIDRKHLVML